MTGGIWDPWEAADDEERNEWAVRDQLYAQRRLAEIEAGRVNSREAVRKMLARVVPGPKVCCYARKEKGKRSMWSEEADESTRIFVCKKPGVRYVALSGNWYCEEHDPLRLEWHRCLACEQHQGIEVCSEREGPWRCSAGIAGHRWPHRMMILDLGED
jgi:hypothetical protein